MTETSEFATGSPANRNPRLRKFGLTLLILAILIAAFYGVENWRGSRAWNACKKELEAKGEQLDWLAFAPKPVPDDQNMLKVPLVESWFVKNSPNTNFHARLNALMNFTSSLTNNPRVELVVLLPSSPGKPLSNEKILTLDCVARSNFYAFLKPCKEEISIRRFKSPLGGYISAARTSDHPLRIYLCADRNLTRDELETMIKKPMNSFERAHFSLAATEQSNVFRVTVEFNFDYTAADFVAWSNGFKPEFDAIRAAARRPQVYWRYDPTNCVNRPWGVINAMRLVTQVTVSRAYANMLLDRPDEAVQDLALLSDLERCLHQEPPTLVNAMMRVAIAGMHASAAEKGFREKIWQATQCKALQAQFEDLELLSEFVNAFRVERAYTIYMANHHWQELITSFLPNQPSRTRTHVLYTIISHGWILQNEAMYARAMQIEGVDLGQMRIYPERIGRYASELETMRLTPYNWLAKIAVDHMFTNWKTTPRNQTWVFEALLACALERYWFAHGTYPETLDALTPQYLETLPHDLVTGEPLKYRRLGDDRFLLHAVGWDGIDDGGDPIADWVWCAPERE